MKKPSVGQKLFFSIVLIVVTLYFAISHITGLDNTLSDLKITIGSNDAEIKKLEHSLFLVDMRAAIMRYKEYHNIEIDEYEIMDAYLNRDYFGWPDSLFGSVFHAKYDTFYNTRSIHDTTFISY